MKKVRNSVSLFPEPKTAEEFNKIGENLVAKFGPIAGIGWHMAIQCYQNLLKTKEGG